MELTRSLAFASLHPIIILDCGDSLPGPFVALIGCSHIPVVGQDRV